MRALHLVEDRFWHRMSESWNRSNLPTASLRCESPAVVAGLNWPRRPASRARRSAAIEGASTGFGRSGSLPRPWGARSRSCSASAGNALAAFRLGLAAAPSRLAIPGKPRLADGCSHTRSSRYRLPRCRMTALLPSRRAGAVDGWPPTRRSRADASNVGRGLLRSGRRLAGRPLRPDDRFSHADDPRSSQQGLELGRRAVHVAGYARRRGRSL